MMMKRRKNQIQALQNFPYLVIQQVSVHECSRRTQLNFPSSVNVEQSKSVQIKMVLGYMGLIYFHLLFME